MSTFCTVEPSWELPMPLASRDETPSAADYRSGNRRPTACRAGGGVYFQMRT
jgi:hypothetical protein